MFAVLFTEAMDPFYRILLAYPVIIFSALVILCVFFSLIAVLGFLDLDFLNIDVPDVDPTNSLSDGGADSLTSTHILAGILMRLGLIGIPMPLIFFMVSLIGWMISFTAAFYLYDYIPGGFLRFIVGTILLFAVLYFSAYLTGKILKPFKSFFETADQEVEKNIIGQIGIVRTSKVTHEFGEANVNDGGAGLIVKVRAFKSDEEFHYGDRVVLLDFVPEEHIYKVISEKDFKR